jgi:hypothetical protein
MRLEGLLGALTVIGGAEGRAAAPGAGHRSVVGIAQKHASVALAPRLQRACACANAIPGTGVPPPAGSAESGAHDTQPSADAVSIWHNYATIARRGRVPVA